MDKKKDSFADQSERWQESCIKRNIRDELDPSPLGINGPIEPGRASDRRYNDAGVGYLQPPPSRILARPSGDTCFFSPLERELRYRRLSDYVRAPPVPLFSPWIPDEIIVDFFTGERNP